VHSDLEEDHVVDQASCREYLSACLAEDAFRLVNSRGVGRSNAWAVAVLYTLVFHAVGNTGPLDRCRWQAGNAHAAHQQVNELVLKCCPGDYTMDQDHTVADHETVVGQDNGVVVEVEVDSPRDEVAAHRRPRHKAKVAVSMDLAY
jgi:hypothetical protein